MKKTLAIILTLTLALTLAACAVKQPSDSASDATQESAPAASAKELLDTVWNTYTDDEKFPAAGGDYSEENMTDDAPGNYSIADKSELDRVFGLSSDAAEQVDDAASIGHMMNANTFTCGAFHLKDGADIAALAESTRQNIQSRQWMCGFPDKLTIVSVGNYLVTMFGAEDLVDTFTAKLTAAFSTAQILADEAIA